MPKTVSCRAVAFKVVETNSFLLGCTDYELKHIQEEREAERTAVAVYKETYAVFELYTLC